MTPLLELRQLVRELLLAEANAIDFANNLIGRYGVIRFQVFDHKVTFIAISTKERVKHDNVVTIPKVLGSITATQGGDNVWRINKMYADNASAAILLLAATLESLKKVYADYSVSPAAQQVIKRYFDKVKDDPTLVTLNDDPYRNHPKDNDPDFLKAAFLGPVGFNMRAAVKQAELAIDDVLIDQDQEDVENAILDAASYGFDTAYSDNMKTKRKKRASDVPSEA